MTSKDGDSGEVDYQSQSDSSGGFESQLEALMASCNDADCLKMVEDAVAAKKAEMGDSTGKNMPDMSETPSKFSTDKMPKSY